MHRVRRPDDAAAERLADRLVPEADAEQRHPARRLAHQLEADAGAVGVAGTRRQDDPLRRHGDRLGRGERVVAAHDEARPEAADEVEKIVGKAVVVID